MMGRQIRLDRFLTDMGKGSRSQIRQAAKKGRIQVNGQIEKQTDRKVDTIDDIVTLDGSRVPYQTWEYFMLNKPQGVVSATEDRRYPTVVELLHGDKRKDLFPVGRLDLDTEGLLLLTNDGELAHNLLSPKKHVDKTYFAKIEGKLPEDAIEQMAKGMRLKDQTPVQPAKLTIGKLGSVSEVFLTIQEGKFHQVKRMFEALDCQVVYLKRLSMGSLFLDETLQPGEYRPLTQEEIICLKNSQEKRTIRNSDGQKNNQKAGRESKIGEKAGGQGLVSSAGAFAKESGDF